MDDVIPKRIHDNRKPPRQTHTLSTLLIFAGLDAKRDALLHELSEQALHRDAIPHGRHVLHRPHVIHVVFFQVFQDVLRLLARRGFQLAQHLLIVVGGEMRTGYTTGKQSEEEEKA
jgi:hypothetical protein